MQNMLKNVKLNIMATSPEALIPYFVLGADDPEMRRIRDILDGQGLSYAEALSPNGGPVNGQTAYQARTTEIPLGHKAVFVECQPQGVQEFVRIDHHRPGDPGYDLPASEALRASSLGQVLLYLGLKPTHEDEILAASDHNFAAAYRGEVPNVKPKEVLQFNIDEIAKSHSVDRSTVERLVQVYSEALNNSTKLDFVGQPVSDLRKEQLGDGYSLEYLSAQVAVVVKNSVALLTTNNGDPNSTKVVLTGHVSEESAQYFIDNWAPSQGLKFIYGVPKRGYAGGYLPNPDSKQLVA